MKIIIASCVIVQCALFLSVIDLQRARRDLEQKINVLMFRDETQPAFEAQLINGHHYLVVHSPRAGTFTIHSNMCHGCAELKK